MPTSLLRASDQYACPRTAVNDQPGAAIFDRDRRVVYVIALDIADGAIHTIRSVVNPDKLRHLGSMSDVARLRQKNPVPGTE